MIYMMENYANNLEDIVTERTSQLIDAKIETEELLYKIFPRSCVISLMFSDGVAVCFVAVIETLRVTSHKSYVVVD